MASDKNHRPCLPLKPQEKGLLYYKFKKIKYFFWVLNYLRNWETFLTEDMEIS